MGLDDRDYMRERRLHFPDVTPRRPWWRKWRSWLPIAGTVVGLDIPDEYEFMDPELVRLLQAKVGGRLG